MSNTKQFLHYIHQLFFWRWKRVRMHLVPCYKKISMTRILHQILKLRLEWSNHRRRKRKTKRQKRTKKTKKIKKAEYKRSHVTEIDPVKMFQHADNSFHFPSHLSMDAQERQLSIQYVTYWSDQDATLSSTDENKKSRRGGIKSTVNQIIDTTNTLKTDIR